MHIDRSVSVLLVLLMAGALIACGGSGGNTDNTVPQGTVDQDYVPGGGGASTWGTSLAQDVAQTFTAGRTGILLRVELMIGQFAAGGDLIFDVRPAPGGVPTESNASALVTVTVPDGTLAPAKALYVFDVSVASVTLNAGVTYALVLRTTGGNYSWSVDAVGTYTGGSAYARSLPVPGTWGAFAQEDNLFRTWMQP